MCYWLHEYFTNQLGENNLFGLFAWMLTENDSWTYFTADDALLKDVITPGSELLERISQELNRDDNIGVKNYIIWPVSWKYQLTCVESLLISMNAGKVLPKRS